MLNRGGSFANTGLAKKASNPKNVPLDNMATSSVFADESSTILEAATEGASIRILDGGAPLRSSHTGLALEFPEHRVLRVSCSRIAAPTFVVPFLPK